jgi:hypothetical protein
VWWSLPAAKAAFYSGTPAIALAVGVLLTGPGFLMSALCVWEFLTVTTCVATPGRLDVFRGGGVLRPRLIASLGEGPIEAVRTTNRHQEAGPLCVQARVPFVDEAIELYYGEENAAWVARFLAKESGWQVFVSSDVGSPERQR